MTPRSRLELTPIKKGFILAGIRLRDEDEKECRNWGNSSEEALELSLENSIASWFATLDGEPYAVFGYGSASLVSEKAYCWALTFPKVNENPLFFLRGSKRLFKFFLEGYNVLEALVDTKHIAATRWLAWLGFRDRELILSPIGSPFLIVEARR